MINSNTLTRYKKLTYSSIEHLDEEDLQGAEVLISTDECLFAYENNEQDSKTQLHWACSSKKAFIDGMKEVMEKLENILYIEYIPKKFISDMNILGFSVVSEYMDFWNYELHQQDIPLNSQLSVRVINDEEFINASAITFACAGQSRGFDGKSSSYLKEWDKNPKSEIFVVEKQDKIVGVALVNLYGFDTDKGICLWLRLIAVDPKEQNQGIGRYLLKHCINWAVQNKAVRSFLHADILNNNAIVLYNSLGYNRAVDEGQINMETTE